MADWIRMRSSLPSNPRLAKMARVLLAEREFLDWLCPGCDVPVTRDEAVTKRHIPVVTRLVIGGLLPVWSMVNETAARDGVVRHATSRDIDDIAGIPCFGKALIAVEWLEEIAGDEGVRFVNFEEHNSPQKERSLTSKSGAERSKAYRERKAMEAAASQQRDGERDDRRDVTSDVTRDDREEKSRGEKKRRTKKGAKAPLSPVELPTWMTALIDLWHTVLPELPGVEVMNEERLRALREFRDWVLTTPRRDRSMRATNDDEMLVWAKSYFERARLSDFIMGRGVRSPEHKNWRCSLEYLLSAKGMQKVIEQIEAPA